MRDRCGFQLLGALTHFTSIFPSQLLARLALGTRHHTELRALQKLYGSHYFVRSNPSNRSLIWLILVGLFWSNPNYTSILWRINEIMYVKHLAQSLKDRQVIRICKPLWFFLFMELPAPFSRALENAFGSSSAWQWTHIFKSIVLRREWSAKWNFIVDTRLSDLRTLSHLISLKTLGILWMRLWKSIPRWYTKRHDSLSLI